MEITHSSIWQIKNQLEEQFSTYRVNVEFVMHPKEDYIKIVAKVDDDEASVILDPEEVTPAFVADVLADKIKEQRAAKWPSAQPGWIPCSERLPIKEKKRYWVCTDTEYQCECRWTNNRFGLGEGEWGWSIFDTPQYSKPIAWMPLPEPYKEEGEEK